MKTLTKKEKAIDMVKTVLNLHTGINLDDLDCIEVWHCYILGNEKWLFAVTDEGIFTDDYFEVTYNKSKDEFYVDRYVKQSNDCFKNL